MKTTVVRNHTLVVQARQKGVCNYRSIGRPGRFGNPWKVGQIDRTTRLPMTLKDVLRKYEALIRDRLRDDPEFRAAFLALRGQTLGCPCPGAAADPGDGEKCHGHVMVRVLEELSVE